MADKKVWYVDATKFSALTRSDVYAKWDRESLLGFDYKLPKKVTDSEWSALRTLLQQQAPEGCTIDRVVANVRSPHNKITYIGEDNLFQVLECAEHYNAIFDWGDTYVPGVYRILIVFVSCRDVRSQFYALEKRLDKFL